MSDNIYEITKKMQDKQVIQKDMQEAISIVVNMFHEKYTNKIFKALQKKQHQLEKNPNREVRLLNAIKLFMPESQHENIDKAIKALIMRDAINSFKLENNCTTKDTQDIHAASKNSIINDPSIHHDGIYDIDKSCLKNSKNINYDNFTNNMLLLVLLNLL